jgi:hypothetical protein
MLLAAAVDRKVALAIAGYQNSSSNLERVYKWG